MGKDSKNVKKLDTFDSKETSKYQTKNYLIENQENEF